jgi:hypothetical protein
VTNLGFRLGAERATIRHAIMQYRVRLKCYDAVANQRIRPGAEPDAASRCRWMPIDQLHSLPFSSPQRRIVASLQSAPAIQESLFG